MQAQRQMRQREKALSIIRRCWSSYGPHLRTAGSSLLLLGPLLSSLLLLQLPIEDLAFHLVALKLPLLDLLLVGLKLLLEFLEDRRDVRRGQGRIELQLLEKYEGLCVVLDGFGGILLLVLVRLGLLPLGGREEELLLPLLLGHQDHGAVGVVVPM